jgi:hypothetical protein
MTRRPWGVTAALVVGLLVLTQLVPGCGPSPLQLAMDAYKPKADALLGEERRTWEQLQTLGQARSESAGAYEAFVAGEGRTFYRDFEQRVRAIEPGDPEIERVHAHFVTMAERMVEFFELEARNREVYRRQRDSLALQQLQLAGDHAEATASAYGEAAQGVQNYFDGRYTELGNLAERFRKLMAALTAGTRTVEDVEASMRSNVLAPVQRLRGTKFQTHENGRMLKAAITAADEYYRLYIEVLGLIDEGRRAAAPASKAIERAEAARRMFKTQLKTLILQTQ